MPNDPESDSIKPEVEVLAVGLGHPEGPDVLGDGRVIFANTYRSEIAVWEQSSGLERFAYTGGAPNACMVGGDGHIYVTMHPSVVDWVPDDPRPGSIVRVTPTGTVEIFSTMVDSRELNAPNDLTFGVDGRLYFTDSGAWNPNNPDPGYICVLDSEGRGEIVAAPGRVYPNGITAEADGSIVWVESYTRMVRRWTSEAAVSNLARLPEGHMPDGLKVDGRGRLWITSIGSGGIDVIEPDGTYAQFVETGGLPLNCVFGDSDQLYVCDGGGDGPGEVGRGRLVRFSAGVGGMRLFRGFEM